MSGTLQLGVIDTITCTWLIDLIHASNDRFPNLTLDLTADTSLRLSDMLKAGEIDMAILMGPVLEASYISMELCTFACRWVASPALTLPGGSVSLFDLARYPVIPFPRHSQPHADITRFLEQKHIPEIRIFTANSLATIIRMTVDGLGVATIPPLVAPRGLTRGELVLVDAETPIPPMRFPAVCFDGQSRLVPAAVSELARDVAHAYLRRVDPDWGWDRNMPMDPET